MQSDPASSSIAGTHSIPAGNSSLLETKQRQAATPVGRGAHAPGTAAAPAPTAESKSQDAKTTAHRLVKKAIEDAKIKGGDKMEPLWSLDEAYRRAKDRPDVQREMLINPDFRKVVDGTAKFFFDSALAEKGSRFCPGDLAVQSLSSSIPFLHPDVEGALVVSSARIFVQYHERVNGPIFSSEKMVTIPGTDQRETQVAALGRSLGSKNPEVSNAIAVLQTMVGPSPR